MVLGRDVAATEFVGKARLPAGRAGIRGLAFLSGCWFKERDFRGAVFCFRVDAPKSGCACVSSRPHPTMRPTLRRRLAEGGALVLGRNVAATEFVGKARLPAGRAGIRGLAFRLGCWFKERDFRGLFFAFGLMRQKAIVGAYRVDLTRR